jgi:hypothetical protein
MVDGALSISIYRANESQALFSKKAGQLVNPTSGLSSHGKRRLRERSRRARGKPHDLMARVDVFWAMKKGLSHLQRKTSLCVYPLTSRVDAKAFARLEVDKH